MEQHATEIDWSKINPNMGEEEFKSMTREEFAKTYLRGEFVEPIGDYHGKKYEQTRA